VGQTSGLPVVRASGPDVDAVRSTEPEAPWTGRPEVCPTPEQLPLVRADFNPPPYLQNVRSLRGDGTHSLDRSASLASREPIGSAAVSSRSKAFMAAEGPRLSPGAPTAWSISPAWAPRIPSGAQRPTSTPFRGRITSATQRPDLQPGDIAFGPFPRFPLSDVADRNEIDNFAADKTFEVLPRDPVGEPRALDNSPPYQY
jgi:hypothetical protein